jgi:hypothetical protein
MQDIEPHLYNLDPSSAAGEPACTLKFAETNTPYI